MILKFLQNPYIVNPLGFPTIPIWSYIYIYICTLYLNILYIYIHIIFKYTTYIYFLYTYVYRYFIYIYICIFYLYIYICIYIYVYIYNAHIIPKESLYFFSPNDRRKKPSSPSRWRSLMSSARNSAPQGSSERWETARSGGSFQQANGGQ